MKIIIQQYLSTLKESKELDAILPDLLLSMNLQPITKPQIGVRQHGVDLAAIGKDLDENIQKLFLFVIKCGDIGRNEWDSNKQSVRQTLNEIQDSYIPHFIPTKYKDLPIEIILTTGGSLLQETQDLWNGYISNNEKNNIKYDFWGGDKLAILFHQFLFNESILIQEYRSLFRKILVMLSEPSYDLKDFYLLFDKFISKLSNSKTKLNIKILKTAKLILKIAIEWAKESNNLKHCINMAEFCLLKYWNSIKNFSLDKSKIFITEFIDYYNTLYNLLIDNNNKFVDLYYKKNGLHGHSGTASPEVETLTIYEQLGFLSELGIMAFFEFNRYKNNCYAKTIDNIVENIKNLMKNHRCLLNPLYDNHIIEIYMAFYLLIIHGKIDYIKDWLYQSLDHILYAYNIMGKYYPTCTNDFYNLIYETKESQEELFCSSTLLFYYLVFAAIIQDEDLYKFMFKKISESFSKTDIQFWFPDSSSEEYVYNTNAGYTSGFSFVCSPIPNSISEMEKLLNSRRENEIECKDFSCFKNGFTDLLFISNRFFRTPIIPDSLLCVKNLLDMIQNKTQNS